MGKDHIFSFFEKPIIYDGAPAERIVYNPKCRTLSSPDRDVAPLPFRGRGIGRRGEDNGGTIKIPPFRRQRKEMNKKNKKNRPQDAEPAAGAVAAARHIAADHPAGPRGHHQRLQY